jgi:hypothetical protein
LHRVLLHALLLIIRGPNLLADCCIKVQTLQSTTDIDHSSAPSRLPHIITQAWEAGTTSGRGRRVGHSFGSPTGRASRDGKEGLRGDGRPPVGTLPRIVRPSVERSPFVHHNYRSEGQRLASMREVKASPHLQGGEKLGRTRIDMTQSQTWIVSIARISSMGLITSLLVPLRESLPRPAKCAMNLPIT